MTKTRESFQGVMTGRLVQGDPFEAQTKDQQGNIRVFKAGPKVGQPNPQFFVAVAYRKDDPHWPHFMAMLHRMATLEWPTLFNPATPIGNVFGVGLIPPVNPLFTFKVKDGDGLDRNGKSNADKEGFAGHWIVSYASAYPPKIVRPNGPNVWETITWTPPAPGVAAAEKPIKRGYYIRVAGSVSGNDSPQTPGLFMNLDMIELVGGGVEIIGGPDAASAFATPASLPPGATPLAAGGVAVPPAGAPAPGGGAAPPPPGGAAPPPPAAATAPPPPAGPVMLPAAGATTYEQYRAAGWTDDQLVASGFMTAPAAAPAPAPAPAPADAPAPYGGHMGNGAQTAEAPPPPPSANGATASPTKAMTALANGTPYETFIGKGWTDAQLIANGYMTA